MAQQGERVGASRGRRPSVAAAAGVALLGLVVGWVAGYLAARPSEERMEEALEALVPPEATITDRFRAGSDWNPLRASFSVNAEFESQEPRPGEEVVEQTREAAREAGWRIVADEQVSAGTRLRVETATLEGRASLRYRPDPPVRGSAIVLRRLDGARGIAWGSGAAGAVAAAVLYWAGARLRRREGAEGGGRSGKLGQGN